MSWPWAPADASASSSPSWRSPRQQGQGHRHNTSAAEQRAFQPPDNLPEPQLPPMTHMQSFSAMADLELARMTDPTMDGVSSYHPAGADRQLRAALARLLRAETTFDFAATVKDADAAARAVRPEDRERVAALAAAASARRRAAQRAAEHSAHIVEVIREPVPVAEQGGAGELAMEVVGYVGVTGSRAQGLHEGASTASWEWE